MAMWKLKQLKRWWEQKQGEQGENGDSQPEGDDEGDEGEEGGDGTEDGDDDGDDDGDGEPGEGADSDPCEDGEPGDGEPSDGEGEPSDGDGESGEPEGEGGKKQGHGRGGMDPGDFKDLDKVTDVRDPNVHVENEKGDSSTPEKRVKPVIIIEPVVHESAPPTDGIAAASVLAWGVMLKSIRSGPLRLSLRRLMQRSDTFEHEGGLRSGRLRGQALVRAMCGAENVFERRTQVDGEDVAVSIVIDKSGSMSGPSMHNAAITALLLGETAQNAGAKTEVICFDSGYSREEQMQIAQNLNIQRQEDWLYAEASTVYVIKTFKDHIGKLRRMYTTLCRIANGGTSDASALKWAGDRLLKQPAPRKILFVIADGEGDPHHVFRYVVDELERKGVIVIGIGIGCQQSFLQRFTHAATIQNASDLCAKAFGMLVGVIAKKQGL